MTLHLLVLWVSALQDTGVMPPSCVGKTWENSKPSTMVPVNCQGSHSPLGLLGLIHPPMWVWNSTVLPVSITTKQNPVLLPQVIWGAVELSKTTANKQTNRKLHWTFLVHKSCIITLDQDRMLFVSWPSSHGTVLVAFLSLLYLNSLLFK